MRLSSLIPILLLPGALVVSACAQQPPRSYKAYVHIVHMDVARNDGVDACLIVDDNGQFQFEQMPVSPEATMFAGQAPAAHRTRGNQSVGFVSARPKVYRGQLAKAKLDQLKSLIDAPELLRLGPPQPPRSMVAAHEYDIVSLRILRPGVTQEVSYLMADGRGAMPAPVRAFVPWMQGVRKALGPADRNAEPRNCGGLEATPDFTPRLQAR